MDKAQLDAIRARLNSLENVVPPKRPCTKHEWEVFKFNAPEDIRALLDEVKRLRHALAECVDELQMHRTDHQAIAVRALRAYGLDDEQITLWRAGELIL